MTSVAGQAGCVDAAMTFAVLRALAKRGVRFKIVGGVALNLAGLPRATQDLDIFVDPEAENVMRLHRSIQDANRMTERWESETMEQARAAAAEPRGRDT